MPPARQNRNIQTVKANGVFDYEDAHGHTPRTYKLLVNAEGRGWEENSCGCGRV